MKTEETELKKAFYESSARVNLLIGLTKDAIENTSIEQGFDVVEAMISKIKTIALDLPSSITNRIEDLDSVHDGRTKSDMDKLKRDLQNLYATLKSHRAFQTNEYFIDLMYVAKNPIDALNSYIDWVVRATDDSEEAMLGGIDSVVRVMRAYNEVKPKQECAYINRRREDLNNGRA